MKGAGFEEVPEEVSPFSIPCAMVLPLCPHRLQGNSSWKGYPGLISHPRRVQGSSPSLFILMDLLFRAQMSTASISALEMSPWTLVMPLEGGHGQYGHAAPSRTLVQVLAPGHPSGIILRAGKGPAAQSCAS